MDKYFPLILIAVVFVVLIVLPARQRKNMQAKARSLQESLTVGTPVLLTSGLHGTVAGLGDGSVDIEIAPGVVTTYARAAVLEVRRPAALDAMPGNVPSDDAPGASRYADGDGDPTDRTR